MMFSIAFQGLIPPKGIGVIDRAFPRLGLNMPHEFFSTDRFDNFGVDAVFPLQEPKDNTFACRRSASLPLSFAPKVGLIQFNLSLKFPAFQLGQVVERFSQPLVYPSNHFDIDAQVLRQSIRRLQLIEPLQNHNLSSQSTQTFTFATPWAFHIPATGTQNFKGSTENTLPAPQKVGRTTKNRVSSSNHAPILAHTGYETP